MRNYLIYLAVAALSLLVSGTALAQTSPSCTQLPNLACVGGDTYTGTHTYNGATIDLDGGASEGTLRLPTSVTPPSCSVGDLYFDTNEDTNGSVMICRATDTWKDIDDDGAGGAFDDAADPVVLNTTTKDVSIGGAHINTSKLSVQGDVTTVPAFTVQAVASPTESVVIVENSGGIEIFNIDNSGDVLMQSFQDIDGGASFSMTSAGVLTMAGDLTVTGGDITLGTTSIFSGGDTASLNNIDGIDSTTETTLEGAIDIAGDVTGTGLTSVSITADAVDGTHIAMGSDAEGDILLMGAGGATYARLPIGGANTVLTSNATTASWGAIDENMIGAGDLQNVLVWNENVCLTADCVGADDPCDCCTGASAGCAASTFTLAATPRADCDAFGAGGTIQAWSNGIMQKCVAAAPGINEFALATNVITPNANSSVMFVTYEQ